jgi:membrane protease YdiL (CAAX protease family)
VVGVTGPIEDYLRELRASLRTRQDETSRILAEAEDHLAESVAAGLAAGLTETEAAEAAISAFGSVRAVVRAHQTRRGRAAAIVADLGMTTWALTGAVLVSVFAIFMIAAVVGFATGQAHHGASGPAGGSPNPLVFVILLGGPVGEVALFGYFLLRRFQRRHGRRPQIALLGGYAPLAGVVIFAGLAVALTVTADGGITAHHVVRQAFAAGSLAAAAIFAALTRRRRLRDRRRTQ